MTDRGGGLATPAQNDGFVGSGSGLSLHLRCVVDEAVLKQLLTDGLISPFDGFTMTMMHSRFALLAAMLLAACGSEPSADGGASAPDSAVSAGAAAQPVPADTQPGAPAAGSGERAIVLLPDGLDVTGGGAPKRLAFGNPRAGVLADVGAVLGAPAEQGTMEECPAGPLDQARYTAGLELVFQEGAFVGWFAREGATMRTASGIGPGSTLGQLKAAHPATTVEETSLGTEFAAGELFGVVSDASNAGQVQAMFAGTNCIFR